MADPVRALTHWRRSRHETTREIVRDRLPPEAEKAMLLMSQRIVRLEMVIAALARAARDGDG